MVRERNLKFYMKRIKYFSIVKTLYFNLKYFGIKGFKLPVLCGKNLEFKNLKGKIILDNFKFGQVTIACNDIDDFALKGNWASFNNNGIIHFWGQANLGFGTVINNSGELTVGDNTSITGNSKIICKKEICIGNNCVISWNVNIYDTDYHKIFNENNKLCNENLSVYIGNHSWICSNCSILKGSYIPEETVVAADSIISTKITESNVIASSNGKILKRNITWER